jgi:peroxiredoxin
MSDVCKRILAASMGAAFVLTAVAWAADDKKDEKKPAADKPKVENADEKAKGEKASGPKIGGDAPDFALKGADGKEYKLADYKDKIVLVEWWNWECPWCKKAKPTFEELHKKYGEKVTFLAIDSTNWATAEGNAKIAKDEKIPYPILMDNDGKIGKAYGAKTTPHVFIINKGKLVYNGALSNDQQGTKPKDEFRNYAAEALDAVLAGQPVKLAETTPWGCSVKYKKD